MKRRDRRGNDLLDDGIGMKSEGVDGSTVVLPECVVSSSCEIERTRLRSVLPRETWRERLVSDEQEASNVS